MYTHMLGKRDQLNRTQDFQILEFFLNFSTLDNLSPNLGQSFLAPAKALKKFVSHKRFKVDPAFLLSWLRDWPLNSSKF